MCAPVSVLSLSLSMFAYFLPSKRTRKPHGLNETHSGCKTIFVKHTFLCSTQYRRCAAVESQRVRRRPTYIQPTVEISIHKPSKWISEWVSKWESEKESFLFIVYKHSGLRTQRFIFSHLIRTNFHIEIHAFETRECFYASGRWAEVNNISSIQC